MKTLFFSIILIISLVSIAISDEADGANQKELKEAQMMYCENLATIAELVFTLRYKNASMSTVFTVTNAENSESVEQVILQAYKEPRYTTDEVILRSIQEFRTKIHLQCIQSIKNFKKF
jgi:Mn2+/Fe2+ NRAMP family transporter